MNKSKRILLKSILLSGFAIATLSIANVAYSEKIQETTDTVEVTNTVVLKTNLGDVVLQLNAEKAPKSVANFQQYVASGYYNDTVFHRTIPNFMIQGGGFNVDMTKKDTQPAIENEADNDLLNSVGSVAMARTSDPHSATSQFFINVADNGFLNHSGKNPAGWGYAVFAQVIEGMDIVQKMGTVSTKQVGPHANVPIEPIVIQSAVFR